MTQDVFEVIRAKIKSGALLPPADPPAKSYAGKGSGRTCDACADVIAADDVEDEVDLLPAGTLVFHRNCHLVWQAFATGA